jgi:hypothetical protein
MQHFGSKSRKGHLEYHRRRREDSIVTRISDYRRGLDC